MDFISNSYLCYQSTIDIKWSSNPAVDWDNWLAHNYGKRFLNGETNFFRRTDFFKIFATEKLKNKKLFIFKFPYWFLIFLRMQIPTASSFQEQITGTGARLEHQLQHYVSELMPTETLLSIGWFVTKLEALELQQHHVLTLMVIEKLVDDRISLKI